MIGLLFFHLFLGQVHATETVLVQAPHSSSLDYRAWLKAHSDLVSPSTAYLNSHPVLSEREKLLQELSAAQHAFLEQSMEVAQKKFKDLVSLLGREDWAKSDREIFLLAYLRLAQLEPDEVRRDDYLLQSLMLGSEVAFDPSLFPPPLIARREVLEKQTPRKNISRRSFGTDWTHLLINGQDCTKLECGSWPTGGGVIRVTLISDQWLPQTATLDIKHLEEFHPAMIAWISGSCGQNHWHPDSDKFQNRKAFWNLDCERPTLPPIANYRQPTPPPVDVVPDLQVETKAPTPLYESKWVWIGVGIVAAVLVARNSQQREDHKTSTTYGF